jgi:hypothetical protein
MKRRAAAIASAFFAFVPGLAFAHGDHKPAHGGAVGRPDDDFVVEFVMEKGTVSLYVHDGSGQPILAEDLVGTLTLVPPQHPTQEVKLVSAGQHKLAGPGIKPTPGDRLRAHIRLPSGEEFEAVVLFSEANLEKPGLSFSADAFVLPGFPNQQGDKLP